MKVNELFDLCLDRMQKGQGEMCVAFRPGEDERVCGVGSAFATDIVKVNSSIDGVFMIDISYDDHIGSLLPEDNEIN